MSVADELSFYREYLGKSYDAAEGKGATMPQDKNMENLPATIESITGGGGGGGDEELHEFDSGPYVAIAYTDSNKKIQYYQAKTASEIQLNFSYQPNKQTLVTIDGTPVLGSQLVGVSFNETYTPASSFFLYNFTSLQKVYGLEKWQITTTPEYFLSDCTAFNQDIYMPNVQKVGNNFLRYAYGFSGKVELPNATSIGSDFMTGCRLFNNPLSLPLVTQIQSSFLRSCSAFNQPLYLPEVQTIGDNFLRDASGIKNIPLEFPKLKTIGEYFMGTASSFSGSITLGSVLTSVGSYFMQYTWNFIGPLNVLATGATPTDNNSLTALSTTDNAYALGTLLRGAGAQAWKDALPDRTSSPYRKLIVA